MNGGQEDRIGKNLKALLIFSRVMTEQWLTVALGQVKIIFVPMITVFVLLSLVLLVSLSLYPSLPILLVSMKALQLGLDVCRQLPLGNCWDERNPYEDFGE